MNTFTPRTAIEASRLIRSTEASFKLNAVIFWNGNNTCTLDSWKTTEEGNAVKSRYEVDLNAGTCNCPNYAEYKTYCKHLIYCDSIAAQEAATEAQETMLSQMDSDAEAAELYPY